MATSPRQIQANQANAARSTGPRSRAGKTRASMNAVSHGLFSRHLLLEGEQPEAYHALVEDLLHFDSQQELRGGSCCGLSSYILRKLYGKTTSLLLICSRKDRSNTTHIPPSRINQQTILHKMMSLKFSD